MSSDEQQPGSLTPNGAGTERISPEPAEPEAVAPAPLPGELLAARRRELNLSIDVVSMRVRLAPRQIVALEANDFAALPGSATVRGFVRSYAKLLGLDPEPLVALLKREPNPAFEPLASRQPLPASGFRARRYAPPVLHRAGARRLAGFAAVVLVFVGTVAFIAYRNGWLQASPSETTLALAEVDAGQAGDVGGQPTAAVPAAPKVSEPSLSGSSTPSPSQPPLSIQPPLQSPPQSVVQPAANASQPMGAPAASRPASEAVPQQAAAAAVPGALQLTVREDAWIEVIVVNGGRKLLSRLVKAGSTEIVPVNEPVVLVVGNATAVDASLRGQTLNLAAAARDNVARLSLK